MVRAIITDLPDASNLPGAVSSEESILDPDKSDVETGSEQGHHQVASQDVPGPRHEQRVDRLEGEGRGLTPSRQGLVGPVRVILDTPGDYLV